MIPPDDLTIQVGQRRLHVAAWGDPASPPVMLIHGLRDHCRNWDWIAADLARHYRVFAPDLRGHGDSDWGGADDYSLAGYVLDMGEVLENIAAKRVAVVGHSLGGAVGLRLAGTYPDRIAAFAGIECIDLPIQRDEVDTPTPYPVRLRRWIDDRRSARTLAQRYYASPQEARDRMAREQPLLDAATVDHLAAHALVEDAGFGWRWKFDHAVRMRAPEDQHGRDLDAVLASITCPVLLAYGSASWIPLPAPERLALLRDHRIVHFPGGTHWLHHEQRSRFTQVINDFLRSTFRNHSHA